MILKKTLAVLLILASMFAFFAVYKLTDEKEHERMGKAEEGISWEFAIPDNPLLTHPEEVYPLLSAAARESGVNVFRTSVHYDTADSAEILKYVLLTGNTRFFDAFRLKSGRSLTPKDTRLGDYFLSSVESKNPKQIGTIGDFADNDRISVRPLKASYDYLPVGGQYFVETTDEKGPDLFIERFVAKLNAHHQELSPAPFTAKDFQTPNNSAVGSAGSPTDYFGYIFLLIFIITLALLVYYMFHESKKIGIMKMHGLSSTRMWFRLIGRPMGTVFGLSVAMTIFAASLIKDAPFQFVVDAIIGLTKTYLMVAVSSLIAYSYISKVRVSDAVKNRKDTRGVFALNIALKAGCSVLLILIGLSIWTEYVEIRTRQERASNWEQSKDYAVFYPFYLGYDLKEEQAGLTITDAAKATDLYPIVNGMGALFVDASEYRKGLLPPGFDLSMRSIVVNPNYLQKYTVKDTLNNPVQISENTGDWVLLVPEQYYKRVKEIRAFFQTRRAGDGGIQGAYQAEEIVFHKTVPESVRKQSVKIIWTARGQKIFSFDPSVNPEDNNLIADPIVQVLTIKNSLGIDRANVSNGSGGADPLKVKLIGRDAKLTLDRLDADLKKLKLDDNLRRLITVDQYILAEVSHLRTAMKQLLIASLAFVVGLLILVVQNLIIFFDKYQRKFVVRRLFGVGFFRTYREYFFVFSAVWALQLLAAFAVAPANRSPSSFGRLLVMAFAVISIELVASAVSLMFIEKRSKVQALKGGV